MTAAALRTTMILACTAALVVGCSTSTTSGKAVTAASDADAPAVALMDTGTYPITAGRPLGTAGDNVTSQNILEAHRIAEFTVGPWEVDDELRSLGGAFDVGLTLPIASAQVIRDNEVLPNPLADVAEANGFMMGFSSLRVTPTNTGQFRGLQNVVMRFRDAPSAAVAAAEMVAKAPPLRGVPPGPPTPVDGAPEGTALTYALPDDITRVDTFTAHGVFVLYQSARAASAFIGTNPAQIASRALDLQKKRVDEFTPTEPAELAALPLDPTGQMMARTLWAPDNAVPVMAGAWAPQAWLHFEVDPIAAGALFNTASVDVVTQRLTTVYQAGNADGAARLVDEFASQIEAMESVKRIDGVAGLPSARCFERGTGALPSTAPMSWQRVGWRVKCVASSDRYAYTAFSAADAVDTRKQMAAQYRILAGE